VVGPEGDGRAEGQTIDVLEASGVTVRELPGSPVYLHAKLIAGSQSVYVGSQNFSETSLHFNRDVGVVLTDADELHMLQSECQSDFGNAREIGAPN